MKFCVPCLKMYTYITCSEICQNFFFINFEELHLLVDKCAWQRKHFLNIFKIWLLLLMIILVWHYLCTDYWYPGLPFPNFKLESWILAWDLLMIKRSPLQLHDGPLTFEVFWETWESLYFHMNFWFVDNDVYATIAFFL